MIKSAWLMNYLFVALEASQPVVESVWQTLTSEQKIMMSWNIVVQSLDQNLTSKNWTHLAEGFYIFNGAYMTIKPYHLKLYKGGIGYEYPISLALPEMSPMDWLQRALKDLCVE